MAVASTRTLLPLDRFFRIAGVHPLHANQVTIQDLANANFCGVPILQYSWQDADRTGREEIANAIAETETTLMQYLNFSLRPDFFANVPVIYPVPRNPDLVSTSIYDMRTLYRALWLKQGYLISGGQEAKTFVANVPIIYTDNDGDGYKETATITAGGFDPTAVASEVAVYYPGQSGDDTWEIRPIQTTINAGVATVICRREQLVLPNMLFGLAVTAVDGLTDSNFLTNVDVYRHWLNPSSQQVEFRWEQTPYQPGNAAVQYTVQGGAMLIRDSYLGWAALEAAHWDVATQQYLNDGINSVRMPDSARVWFKAGYPLDSHGNMDGLWERCVTYLTLANLDRPLCQCESLETFVKHWAFDFAANSPDHTQQISRKFLDNPLGTTRAARFVWDAIQRHQLPDSDGSQ